MKYLKIAAPKNLMQYIPADWEQIELNAQVDGASLAAIVIDQNSLAEDRMATAIRERSALDIPVVTVNLAHDAAKISQEIEHKAQDYVNENVPRFLRDLVHFSENRPVSFTTPGHHNRRYNAKHPAGVVFNRFF